jgi:hypothetical protein
MPTYLQVIEAAIRPLLDGGWYVVEDRYEPQHFGNGRIVLCTERLPLRLRFTSDRGQLFVEVARGPGWYALDEILALAGESVTPGPWSSAADATSAFIRSEEMLFTRLADAPFVARLVARQ